MYDLIITRAPKSSISLENLSRIRISSSKLTLDGREDQADTPEPDDEKGSTITLEDKSRPLRRSFSFTQRNFRRNAVIEAPGEGLSGKSLNSVSSTRKNLTACRQDVFVLLVPSC